MSFERPRRNSLFATFAAIAALSGGNAEAQTTETDCAAIRAEIEPILRSQKRELTSEEMAKAMQCPDLPENPPEEVSGTGDEDSSALTPRERRDRERREREQRRRPQ